MRKFIDAIKEAGFTKLFWLVIAIVCFIYGALLDGFFPGLAARVGYAAVGIFIYINFNIFIKYYSEAMGAIGWGPEIDIDKVRQKKLDKL